MTTQGDVTMLQPSTESKQIAFRFRTRFHYEIVFSRLTSNPDISHDLLIAAVDVNKLPRLLPTPWPPEPESAPSVVERNALVKMKYIVGRASDLSSLSALSIKTRLEKRSPDIQRIDRSNPFIIEAEVLLRQDGQVTYRIQFPEQMAASGKLLNEHSGDGNDYVHDMIMLAIQKEYEQRNGRLFLNPAMPS